MQRAKESAEAANRAKSDFLAKMSHELRTPLNAILGFTEGLLERTNIHPLNEHQKDRLGKVLFSGQHLLGLINKVLDVTKIETGNMKTDLTTFDIASLVEEVCQMCESLVERKPELRILRDVESGLQPLASDREKIKAILLNLMSNAVTFTGHGAVTLRVRRVDSSLILSVEDTGIGIPKEHLGRVFEAFYQVKQPGGRAYPRERLGPDDMQVVRRTAGGEDRVAKQGGMRYHDHRDIALRGGNREAAMNTVITSVEIRFEEDVVYARQRTRLIAELLGLDRNAQARIGAAVSEIARNAFQYAAGGHVEFILDTKASQQVFLIIVRDRGPGIGDLGAVLDGHCVSPTGMGVGLQGARRMVDHFHIETKPGEGTTVQLGKTLPPSTPPITEQSLVHIHETLCKSEPESPLQEIRLHNQELLHALEELQRRQDRLEQLNRELEDTNRGVLALYAELDEKVGQLHRANQLRARFLSDMSHEFRTPLNTILSLSRLLLDHMDGDLTAEQEKQVAFIHKAAEDSTALVNDVLDLAKIDAGKTEVRPCDFSVEEVFSGLRGMFKPLVSTQAAKLVFEPTDGIPSLFTDEAKVSQILRNFVSNALKFTEQGEVRVSARLNQDGTAVLFAVADTGIGIAPEDQRRVFNEYVQVETAQAGRPKGTGLGLAICRKLAEMLHGQVDLESRLGAGSTFSALIPLRYVASQAEAPSSGAAVPAAISCGTAVPATPTGEPPAPPMIPGKPIGIEQDQGLPLERILIIDDDEAARYILADYLAGTRYTLLEAADGRRGLHLAEIERPHAIILDLKLPDMPGLDVLRQLECNARNARHPGHHQLRKDAR